MIQKNHYIGFAPLADLDQMLDALVHDPPDFRWGLIRNVCRLGDPKDRYELALKIEDCLGEIQDFTTQSRLFLALKALRNTTGAEGYFLVKGVGAFRESDLKSEKFGGPYEPPQPNHEMNFHPVVDFRIHPQVPDMKLFVDMRRAGVSRGVILATDTDPADLDRPSIKDSLYKDYSSCAQSRWLNFGQIMKHLRSNLYSNTHVTNKDVAAWLKDYPEILFGFGSVNLSKERYYVEEKLDQIGKLGLRGVNLTPYSQFFNPAENQNVDLLFQYCRSMECVVVSHSGCGMGPFDILELSRNSNPILWEPILKKYPDVPLVLAHCGSYSEFLPGIWLHEALSLGKNFRNVYGDFSAVEWILDSAAIVKEIRKTITFDRIFFGTDYPFPLASGMGPACLVSSVRANRHLTEKEKHKVLGENAIKLLRSN
ncbi:MAG: amidohydrolase family protein [Desulfomonilaceae bacterium]